ncbi:MAG: hypothetical protein K2Z81_07745, partial [Cyanobacteria bacterium]|nr:hypothetical protein [Cyanobacteriota bacterium]
MIINPERDFLLNQEPDQQQGTKDDCHAAKPFDLNWMLSAAADPDLDSLYKSQRTQVETDEDDNRLEHSTENCLVSFTVDPTIESCHQELQAKPEIGTTAREKVFREMFSYRSGTLDALEILPALQIVSHQLQPKRSFYFPEFPERKNIPSHEIPAGKSVVIDGADKSKLHFSNPDGKPIVDKIEFADANHTEAIYSYDKQGNLTGVTMRQGTKTILDVTQKGDKVLVSSSGSDQKPIELAGNLAMLPDGTWQIKGTTAIECYPDGTLVNSRSGNDKNAFVSVTTTDGTSYTGIRKPDGTASIRSWSGNLDGLGHSVVTYIYGQDKAEPDSIVVSSQGSMDLYQKGKEDADGVPQWLHKSRSVVGQSCDVNTRAIVNDKFPPVPESVKENPEALAIPTTLRDQRYVVEVQASFLQHNQDILQFKKAAVTQQVKAELENDIATGKISPKSGEELPALVKSRVADAFKAMEQEHKKLIDEVKKEAQSLGEKQTGWDKLPATRKAYELTLSWLNEQALPKTYVVLDKLGGVVGANCPLAETAAAKGMSRSEYQKMLEDLVHGNLKGKVLDLDEKQVPSTQDVARMERAVRFVQQSSKQIGELRTDFELKVLFPEVIKYNNLPTEWLDTHGEKPEVHTAALANALDIAYKIRNYAAAIQVIGLHTAEGSRPAIPFPPHCAPEGEYGKLEKLRVDWPKTPGVNGESAKFWEDCKDWLEKYGAEVEKELYAWADGNKNPEHVL